MEEKLSTAFGIIFIIIGYMAFGRFGFIGNLIIVTVSGGIGGSLGYYIGSAIEKYKERH